MLDLDSLMDILSCLVGVMLFMVIYTVLELGATAYQVQMPVASDPGDRRTVAVIARNGAVRPLDTRAAVMDLLSGFDTVSFAGAPDFVRRANQDAPLDDYFLYSLEYEDQLRAGGIEARTFSLAVHEIPGSAGDSIHQLDDGSRFATFLAGLDPSLIHVHFAVDTTGLDVFRRAREMAAERGFTTGWDPFAMTLPLAYALGRQGEVDVFNPIGTPIKPAR